MTTTTISERAGEAFSWFETAERADGERFTRLKDDRPEWVYELVYAAHGDGEYLPDDWRYATIRNALAFLHDDAHNVGEDEWAHLFADEEVDVYTGRRLAWLASNLNRQWYCDEAAREFGYDEEAGIVGLIGMGQYLEARETFAAVLEALRGA